ncbi:hypothetical protein D1164_02060 [Mariniphaga sediminis]|uniref:Uncharacterized protein n=2 Tax=Mariniphaga sediminis TaxID=1628158 RepID=A0A399DAX8_9BACT|nr:hypothetical protein D1164_02060 [Mariniphaga sediminis]
MVENHHFSEMDIDLYIHQIILTYKSSIRFRIGFAVLIIFIGILIIMLNSFNILTFPNEMKSLVSVSGTLVSSICAFPIKEIIDRRNRIKLIHELSEQYKISEGKDKQKVEELIWKIIEKNVVD